MLKKTLFALLASLGVSAVLAAVNLNTATEAELDTLPGVGPATAKAIVAYRTEKGSFKDLEELKNVKGIGQKKFEKLKPEITIGAAQNQNSKQAKPAAAEKGNLGQKK